MGFCRGQNLAGCGKRWYRVTTLFVQLYNHDSPILTVESNKKVDLHHG